MTILSNRRSTLLGWDRGVVLLLILTCAVGSFLTPDFLTTSNIAFVLQDIGEILLIALPMTFLIIAGEIDLSVASSLTLSSSVIGIFVRHGSPMLLGILAGLVTGALCGALNGYLVTKWGLQSLAVTIGTLGLFRGLCFVLLGNNPVNEFPSFWTDLGANNIPHTFLPWSVVLLVPFSVIAWILLHRTRAGRWTFAAGINAEAARYSGIPVKRLKFLLFVFTGFMSGVAGVVYTLRFASASPDGARGYELSVIAAVLFGGVAIAGGVGTMWGVLAAVIELGAIRSVLQLVNFSANALQIVSGALLLFSVAVPRATEMFHNHREMVSSTRKNPLPPPAGAA